MMVVSASTGGTVRRVRCSAVVQTSSVRSRGARTIVVRRIAPIRMRLALAAKLRWYQLRDDHVIGLMLLLLLLG